MPPKIKKLEYTIQAFFMQKKSRNVNPLIHSSGFYLTFSWW